ncbi:MAG: hypothetical protein PHQ34_08975 [Methanothrix sp.]|nr:hypothetical protein [Methanothrix sp.]
MTVAIAALWDKRMKTEEMVEISAPRFGLRGGDRGDHGWAHTI